MKVFMRYSDKATFRLLVVGVSVCFIAGAAFYTWAVYISQKLWNESLKCVNNQDLQCLIEVCAGKASLIEFFTAFTSVNISLLGVVFGFLVVTLYKNWTLGSSKVRQLESVQK